MRREKEEIWGLKCCDEEVRRWILIEGRFSYISLTINASFCSAINETLRYPCEWLWTITFNLQITNYDHDTYFTYSLNARWTVLAALSSLFQILVEDTISNSFLVGNCFLNLTSICSWSCLNVSVSSTCPKTCLTNEWRMSKQWILFPLAIGRLKLTRATVLGLEMPNGGSKDAMKSESWAKLMNCVACGSYLQHNLSYDSVT